MPPPRQFCLLSKGYFDSFAFLKVLDLIRVVGQDSHFIYICPIEGDAKKSMDSFVPSKGILTSIATCIWNLARFFSNMIHRIQE